MRQTVLPWESVPGPHYLACDTQQRKGWVKAGGWVLVAALLVAGVVTRWKIALVFGVLYTLALLMEKSVAVTQRGLEIFHQMQVTTNYERWDWADVYAVTHESDPRHAGQTILYFTKGDRTKRAAFADADAEKVLRLARERNPDVKVYDGKKTRDRADAIRNRKKP